MTKNDIPFWESNLNSHTMFSASIKSPQRGEYNAKPKGSYLKSTELDAYVSASYLRKEYNIGGQKLKALFATLGTIPKYNGGNTYYSTEYLDRAIELLSIKREREVIDMNKHISNKELMDMFNFNTYKAWYIATNSNLVKIKFSGNINYYEREKAIAEFSKHIKK